MTKKLLYFLAMTLLFTATLQAKTSDYLISAEDAVKLIGKPGVVFVTGDSDTTYNLNHIVGSVEMYAHHLHHSDITGEMHCAPLFMCPEEAEEYIGSKGIDNDTLVIAYDNFRGPNATGVFAFFKSFGHDKIKLLNGGYEAVKAFDPNQEIYDQYDEEYKSLRRAHSKEKKLVSDGKGSQAKLDAYGKKMQELQEKMDALYPMLLVQGGEERPEVEPKNYTVDVSKIDRSWIVGKEEIYKAMKDIREKGQKKSQYVILDSRAMNEIIGERKLDNVARGGHVPGAKFIEWSQITDFEKQLSFKDKKEMQKIFEKYGVTKDKTIYAYCHVGAGRSSHLVTALKMLGYEDAKVYTGSWDEWGNSLNMPIAR